MYNLPARQKSLQSIVPIGKAAEILGVSIDTLRRWDKAGKVTSVRPDGKDRFFNVVELEKIKANKALSISEASQKLGVSASTLRRYEQRGILRPKRNDQGERVYDEDLIQNFNIPQAPAPEVKAKPRKISFNSSSWQYPPAFIIVVLLVTTIFSTLYIQDQYRDNKERIAMAGARVLGAKDQGGIIGFFAGVGERIDQTNKKVLEQYKTAFSFAFGSRSTQRLAIDQKTLDNINAKLLQGKKPGETEGDLAFFASGGRIPGLRISSANMLAGSVSGGVGGTILDLSITLSDLANDSVDSSKILNGTISNADLVNSSVNSEKIEDNTVSADDLNSTLAFGGGALIDLSDVTHDAVSNMGLILPNVSSASPSPPETGEGYLAYDTAGDQVLVYNGVSWAGIGGSVTLAASGGLEYVADELSLLTSCIGGQILKWNGSAWACGNDTGGGGGGMATVEKGNVNAVTTAVSLDFSSDFGVTLDTGEAENEADIAIDYTASKITRTDQTHSISGAWTFAAPLIIGNASGNDFLEFAEEATNPTCGAGTYAVWANSGDGKLKKCQNGAITDLDTTSGGGSITIRETDISPSVSSVTTVEFGPTGDSTADFVVSDQTGGVARVVLGSNVAHINATESVSGAWTLSNLTISDTTVSLSGGSTAFDMTAGTDTIFDITNAGAGVGKLRIDSLTNGGAGCNTIDTTADGTLVCGSDEGGAGGGIATVRESDASPSYGTLTTLEFGPATTSEDDFIVTNPSAGIARVGIGSKIAHINAAETITGGWTFNTAATTFTTGITANGGITTAAGTGLTLATGNNGAGTAGNIGIDVGTSTSGNGSISIGGTNAGSVSIGRATVTTTVNGTLASGGVSISGGSVNGTTIGASTPSTGAFTTLSSTGATSLGNNSSTVAIDGTNFDLTTAGVVTLIGGQTIDITSAVTAGAGAALTLKPGLSTGASSSGGLTTISGGDGSGTTTVTGGGLTLTAGSATGGSGTRTGGNVTINAGDGATNDGVVTIGSANSRQINLGNATNNTTITLTGTGLTTLGGDLSVSGGTFTGADSDVIEVGSVSNTVSFTLGASSEYTFNTTSLTLGADNSIGNGTWSISAAGAGTSLSANDLTGCTNCIGATEVDESTISAANLSDGTNIAHINAVETITGGWTFNTAATTFTTAINANGGITTSTTDTALAFTANGAGDFTFTGDSDTNFQINATPTGDVSLNSIAVTLNATGTGATGTLQGMVISQSDNANTGVFDSLLVVTNAKTPETVANGILIEQSGSASTMTAGLHVLGTAGAITDGINIEDGAGTIADGLQFTGTFTNLINSTNFSVSNAGAVTAVGVNSGSGQIQGTGGVSITGTTSINASASTSTTEIGTGTTSGAITIGGGSNTLTIATTSWDVSSAGAFSGLTTLGLSGAITGATATDTINGIIINSGAVSNVGTLSSSGDWTWTAATPTLSVNNTDVLSIGDGTDKITLDTTDANTYFRVGDASNYYTFDFEDGPTYTGTARPTKRITLTPEYAGGSLTADGSSNVGTMTSDNDKTASSYRNYYNWTTSQGSSQDYDIWIKVPLPADFDGMLSTDAITIEAWSDTLANTTAEIVQVYDTGNTADCTTAVNIEPGSPSTWTDKVTDQGCTGGTYTANGIMTVQLRLGAVSSANARVGRIYIDYKAKF